MSMSNTSKRDPSDLSAALEGGYDNTVPATTPLLSSTLDAREPALNAMRRGRNALTTSSTVVGTGPASRSNLVPPSSSSGLPCLNNDDEDDEAAASWLAHSDDNDEEGGEEENQFEYRQSRILDRDGAFRQSRGRWSVERLSRGSFASFQQRQRRRENRRGQYRQEPSLRHDETRFCMGSQSCCCCCRRSSTSRSEARSHDRSNCFSCWRNCCINCWWRFWNEWIKGDWFHRLAYQRTCVLMFILFCCYTSIVVFFAFVYLAVSLLGRRFEVDPDNGSTTTIAFCDMDINDHMEALYFSLSTMTTIGYGVSDYYFGGCWTPLLLVLWQVCSAICFDAVAVGLLFQKISRGRKRAQTILFSNKAVIQRIRGVPHFMFRLGELRNRYHLMQASVRVYCIRHERSPVHSPCQTSRPEPDTHALPSTSTLQDAAETTRQLTSVEIQTTHFVTRQVKLLHPDETSGSHVLMSLPQVAVHRMDETSPLVPPRPIWYNADGSPQSVPASNLSAMGVASASTATNNRTSPDNDTAESLENEFDDIQHFLWDRDVEIVVLVEGTDEGTGAPTQARHSYKLDDLAWNHTFTPCVFPRQLDDSASAVPSIEEGTSSGVTGNGRSFQDGSHRRRRGDWRQNGSYSTLSGQSQVRTSQSGVSRRGRRFRRNEPVLSIDFARFHDIEPVPMDCDSCPYILDTA